MATPSERAAKRRASRKAAGLSTNERISKFDKSVFIGIDGEGFSEGDLIHLEVDRGPGAEPNRYAYKEHFYAFLAASNGNSVYAPEGRLTTKQCFDFLLDQQETDPNAILVAFSSSYDVTQMLVHGIDREDIRQLLQGSGDMFAPKHLDVTLWDSATGEHDYRIEVTLRKQLTICRWDVDEDKYVRVNGKLKKTPHRRAVLWDVWGFFQGSFIGAMKDWIPDHPWTKEIIEMKSKRSQFTRDEIDRVKEYCFKEVDLLVLMMEIVKTAIDGMGLKITRWDGAGAVAAAMMAKHEVKNHKAPSPLEVYEAARFAYSGGHIEMCKIGHYLGPVYHYDINSAYPHIFRSLPSLNIHAWESQGDIETISEGHTIHDFKHMGEPPAGFTLVHCVYDFPDRMPFYPLFFRDLDGSIKYPQRGRGWYWFPEYEAARAYVAKLGGTLKVLAYHHMKQTTPSPFKWLEDYFEERKRILDTAKKNGTRPEGKQMMMKLGYNSCYGKTAQQVGARMNKGVIQEPAYYQLEWSGYVTAGCRAQIMQAAIQEPDAIISMATDGIFSTKPLDLYAPPEKILGAWEAQTHDGITAVMPGIYWLIDGNKLKHYSRGFDKETMEHDALVVNAWRRRERDVDIKTTRLITAGTAVTSDNFWQMRGCFVECFRSLNISGANSKRYGIRKYHNPHKGLIPLDVALTSHCFGHPDELDPGFNCSKVYSVEWLEYEEKQERQNADFDFDEYAAELEKPGGFYV